MKEPSSGLRARIRMATTVAVALLILVPLATAAQDDARLLGRVHMASTGEPIEGAEVRMEDMDRRQLTTNAGLFRFDDLPSGPQVVTVSYLGMQTEQITVDLRSGRTEDVSLSLEMRVIPIPELYVRVDRTHPVGKLFDFYRRAEAGQGYYITRDDITNRRPSRMSDMLRRVPGINVGQVRFDRAQVTMGRRRGCVPEYFLDGIRTPNLDVDALQPIDVAGVEVYRGHATIPPEFISRARCGAIIIWTRDPSRTDVPLH